MENPWNRKVPHTVPDALEAPFIYPGIDSPRGRPKPTERHRSARSAVVAPASVGAVVKNLRWRLGVDSDHSAGAFAEPCAGGRMPKGEGLGGCWLILS